MTAPSPHEEGLPRQADGDRGESEAPVGAAHAQIDTIDEQIWELIHQRCIIAATVQAARVAASRPRQHLARENEVLARYRIALGAPGHSIATALLSLARGTPQAQPNDVRARHACLGPAGTFSEEAARSVPDRAADIMFTSSVAAALAAVRQGEALLATVPMENSEAGILGTTIDGIVHGEPLVIHRQVLLSISLVLAAREGTQLKQVRRVASHPHALAQASAWLRERMSCAATTPSDSTAAAAMGLCNGAPYDAVVCSRTVAEKHRLEVLATGLTPASTQTRFVTVVRPGLPPAVTGDDTTALALFTAIDGSPNELRDIIDDFSGQGISLRRIEPRPLGNGFDRRYFYLEASAHITEPGMRRVILSLRRRRINVRYLGSFTNSAGPSVD